VEKESRGGKKCEKRKGKGKKEIGKKENNNNNNNNN
jgi:hypothetical protein